MAIDSSTTFPITKLGLGDPTYGIAPSRMPVCPAFLPRLPSFQGESLSAKEAVPTWVAITETTQWSPLTLFQKAAVRPLLLLQLGLSHLCGFGKHLLGAQLYPCGFFMLYLLRKE